MMTLAQKEALERLANSGLTNEQFSTRYKQATYFVLPTIEELVKGRSSFSVLEIGCGEGPKVCALAPVVTDYLGIDLDKVSIDRAKANIARLGLKNCEAVHLEADDIDRVLASKSFDLILLYAVLEHLTLGERERLLTKLWSALRPGAYIYVGEAPNLISPIDYHSSNMPYFHMLPIDLKQKVYQRSHRKLWRSRVEAEATRELAFFRNGAHVSFYDFDATLMPVENLNNHIVFDNFHLRQLNMNPFRWHEANLLRELAGHAQDNRLDESWRIPRCFSRYWIDFILSKSPVQSSCDAYPTVAAHPDHLSTTLADPFRNPLVIVNKNAPEQEFSNRGAASSRVIVGLLKSHSRGRLVLSSSSGNNDCVIDMDAEKAKFDYWNPNIYVECPTMIASNDSLFVRAERDSTAAISSVLFFK